MNDDKKPTDAAVKKFRDKVRREVLNGLPNEQDRRACNPALHAVLPARRNEADPAPRCRERLLIPATGRNAACRLTRRVVNVLTSKLYNPGPGRGVSKTTTRRRNGFPGVYQDALINSLWQRADRMSTLNGLAAFQAAATGDPAKPIKYQLWSGWHEVIPFEVPGKANEVAAVVTIDTVDMLTRYVLWTEERFETFETDKISPSRRPGARTARYLPDQCGAESLRRACPSPSCSSNSRSADWTACTAWGPFSPSSTARSTSI